MINHAKWHKYSSIALLISALICICSGHKLTGAKHAEHDAGDISK